MSEDEADGVVQETKSNDIGFLVENFSSNIMPMKNRMAATLIEKFLADSQSTMASFLRKKFSLQLSAVESCLPSELTSEQQACMVTSFYAPKMDVRAFLILEDMFLGNVVNLLYGGEVQKDSSTPPIIGKVGKKMAKKITELFMLAFQRALPKPKAIEFHLDPMNEKLDFSSVKSSSQTLFKLSIEAVVDEFSATIGFAFPESLLEEFADHVIEKNRDREKHQAQQVNTQQLEKELVESTLTVVAVLPAIPCKIQDIMKLKSGDQMPISDPSHLYLTVNKKPLFKGMVGNSNNKRVVKITDTI